MDRRFVTFIVLTGLIWATFIGLQMYFAPPPPDPVAEQVEGAGDKPADPANDPDAKPADPEKPVDPAKPPTDPAKPPVEDPATKPAVPATPRTRVSLGSLDAGGTYRMLVTLDSRGAAVERVELNKYNDIEDTSGYLGHLALADGADGGAVVGVVGAGTPAALATAGDKSVGVGLKAGDVITKIDEQAVTDSATVTEYLAKRTRRAQPVVLTVERKGAARPIIFTAALIRRPLEVVRPESHVFDTSDGKKFLPEDPFSLLLTLDSIGTKSVKPNQTELPGLPSLLTSNWTLDEQGADFVQFSFMLDEAALKAAGRTGSLKLVKRYELKKPEKPDDTLAYHLDLKVEVQNLGTEPLSVAYRLLGPTGLPLEGWWYSTKLHPEWFAGAGARDVAWKVDGRSHQLIGCPKIVSEAKALIEEKKPPYIGLLDGDNAQALVYAGVDTQFFASAVMPQKLAEGEQIKFRRVEALPVQDVNEVPKNRIKTMNVSVQLVSELIKVEPEKPLTHEYRVFFGPKDGEVLAAYGLDRFIEFGWSIFKYTALFLQQVLGLLYFVTRNYGISIILLTVIVRSCMVPISLKQAKSAAMMQMLAPEMAKIKEKFPDDPVKQNAAMQELYKKNNFNPFGGCLLVFIQLPIFIGLYRCLSVDIDLRDAPLIPGWYWASNLAGPDMLFRWDSWMPGFFANEADGWLGPFFNFLPLITIALFLIQQKMFTPPPTDEQSRMQQQMMTYMTVFMGVMFYKVPAGLCLYFITSSLWGICERKMLPKPKPGGSGSGEAVSAPSKPASPNGSAKRDSGKKQKRR